MIKFEKGYWEQYLSRPFSLFVTSIWNEWYAGKQIEEVFGVVLLNGLFIEYPHGMVKHWREKVSLKSFFAALENTALNQPEKSLELLKKGLALNTQAEAYFKTPPQDVEHAIQFFINLALVATIFPYFAPEALAKKGLENTEAFRLAEQLRAISHYPKFIDVVILPLVRARLEREGVDSEWGSQLLTLKEILQNDFSSLAARIESVKAGKYFIYQNLSGVETIEWTPNPAPLLEQLEPQTGDSSKTIKGTTAYAGQVQGEARLVLTNNPNESTFNQGDILVATSTSPELMPLIIKAGAIVTDEGGITCHAAVISRELKKPCVVGTKQATQIIKTGDLIEVDADNGVVKII